MKATTLCRWCGGEMKLMSDAFLGKSAHCLRCKKCKLTSDYFDTEAEALAWAEQPIPFLPLKVKTSNATHLATGWNAAIFHVENTLAVKTEEE